MTTLSEDFRAFLLSKTVVADVVGQRVFHNVVPEGQSTPYIVFFQRGAITERATNETSAKPTMVSYDVEFVSLDLAEVDSLATATRDAIDGHRGAFGESQVQGLWVEDQDEDYRVKADGSDRVKHVPSFVVDIRPKRG